MDQTTKNRINRKANFIIGVIQGHDRETEFDGRDCSRDDLMDLLHRSTDVNTKAICHYLLTGELRRASTATWVHYYLGATSPHRLRDTLTKLTENTPGSLPETATQAGQHHLDEWAVHVALYGAPKWFPFTTDYHELVVFLESELQKVEVGA